ncbi:hypothetical protein [Desulfococcus sp.]|uniref:hypothetical protein n=1 Tax=Desulfococcus sp. TaxID=2025834 RepID=UPI003D12266B
MRKSTIFLIHIAVVTAILVLTVAIHPRRNEAFRRKTMENNALLVRQLDITDLCLFTEVRYTRHLSQADLFSAFQEAPLAFEHYPSGSMTRPQQQGYPPAAVKGVR